VRYLSREDRAVDHDELPTHALWPRPRDTFFPFGGGLVDYLRPIGPGVYVGVGWKWRRGRRRARQFLSFLIVREPAR
jgi:hypothetical protein